MQTPSLEEFVNISERYCAFAEADTLATLDDLWKIREMLLQLIYHIPACDAGPWGCDHDGDCPDNEKWTRAYERFSNFDFNDYFCVFDPHEPNTKDEPVTGLLADDLADIYRDLAEGLDNYQKGYMNEARFDWANSYRTHWARHAVHALTAIEMHRINHFSTIDPSGKQNLI